MGWNDWIRTVEVEPSLYAADFANLGEQIDVLLRTGARIFHFDVGDGHFVEPITMGPIVLQSISPLIHRGGGAIDVHLMVERPERHVAAFAEAGADSINIHEEATPHVNYALNLVRDAGCRAGLAITPATPVEMVREVTEIVDIVLCMTVNPGWGGQPFIPTSFDKIARLRSLLPETVALTVDGGVDTETAGPCAEAGATLFVAGSAVFGEEDPAAAYRALVAAAGAT